MMRFKFLLFSTILFLLPIASWAETHTAISASYSDVSAAVSTANSGDTVIVPAGSATWNSSLIIQKGVILKGAGAGNTIITGNVGSGTYLVVYQPSNPALNEPFQITGFTFDFNSNSWGINLINTTLDVPNQIRIDHNNFLNCIVVTFQIKGVYGVIDHNTFTGSPHFDAYGNQYQSWDNLTFEYGSADNVYFEDNNFSGDSTFHSGGHGGRYVSRFNTYAYTGSGTLSPWFDMHGNQASGIYSTMGAEIYGNVLNIPNGQGLKSVHHRGGKAVVFYNKVIGLPAKYTSFRVHEEYAESLSPTTNEQPQHVSDSYYWNNRADDDSLLVTTEQDDCQDTTYNYPCANPSNMIEKNRDWREYNENYNGTSEIGVGCGKELPAYCAENDGFWKTDQSCSTVNIGNIGATPVNPISGTLYKCIATNTWTAYYKPYTYPHPLTQDTIGISPPEQFRLNN